MGIFKSSSPPPPNWSLGSRLHFQQLFPIWGFVCFSKNIFLLSVRPGSNLEGLCVLRVMGRLRLGRWGSPVSWLALPSLPV